MGIRSAILKTIQKLHRIGLLADPLCYNMNITNLKEAKMKIPKTYEEFLTLSENEIDDISKSDMSLQDAQTMMKFFDRFDMDYQNKSILESSNTIIKKFGDYLK